MRCDFDGAKALGQEILASLSAGDPGSPVLRDAILKRFEALRGLVWNELTSDQVGFLEVQDHRIQQAARQLEGTLVKALSARVAHKKMANPRAYGRFQDMRA